MEMIWNRHHNFEGQHAMFSASKPSWLRYDDDKVIEAFINKKAAALGTEMHDVAARLINLGIKQAKSKKTFNMYVNDAIGFKMKTEVVLFYSKNFFGTADAISYREDKKTGRWKLRIHDLKTGVRPADMEQLLVYAALFCLEYRIRPGEIDIELRLYQNDAVIIDEPTAEDIVPIMDKIIHFDKLLEKRESEEE
jgi:hypothetical protein